MAEFSSSAILQCSAIGLRQFLGHTPNLVRITNPDLELEIVAAPAEVTVGERIEFRIMAYGFRQRATNRYTCVTDLEIAEQQEDGPLRAWSHRQLLHANPDGSVTLTDEVTFEPPGGMLGFMLTADRIRESLLDGMEFRYDALRELIDEGVIV